MIEKQIYKANVPTWTQDDNTHVKYETNNLINMPQDPQDTTSVNYIIVRKHAGQENRYISNYVQYGTNWNTVSYRESNKDVIRIRSSNTSELTEIRLLTDVLTDVTNNEEYIIYHLEEGEENPKAIYTFVNRCNKDVAVKVTVNAEDKTVNTEVL